MPCSDCTNPTLCTERCQAYAEQLRICAASGQMEVEEIRKHREHGEMPAAQERNWPEDFAHENGNYMNRCSTCGEIFIGYKRRVTCKVCAARMLSEVSAHVEAGEMPESGPGEADCALCNGRGVWGIPGARCSFCKGTGRVKFWRPRDDVAPKGEAGEMEAAKGEDTPLPTHPQQEKP